MATRKRTTSESGAYMSEYDQEVEKRLKALESQAHTPCGGGGDTSALEAKVDALIAALNQVPSIVEHFPKDAEGNRKISL